MIAWDVDSNDMTPFGGNGHTNQINCIAISGDNVVTCSMDDTVRTTSLDAMNWGASIPTGMRPAEKKGGCVLVPCWLFACSLPVVGTEKQ